MMSLNKNFNKPPRHTRKTATTMSELFEVRKVLTQGQDHLSHSVVIPHKFLADMKITKGDYLKIAMEDHRIWMEKLIQ